MSSPRDDFLVLASRPAQVHPPSFGGVVFCNWAGEQEACLSVIIQASFGTCQPYSLLGERHGRGELASCCVSLQHMPRLGFEASVWRLDTSQHLCGARDTCAQKLQPHFDILGGSCKHGNAGLSLPACWLGPVCPNRFSRLCLHAAVPVDVKIHNSNILARLCIHMICLPEMQAASKYAAGICNHCYAGAWPHCLLAWSSTGLFAMYCGCLSVAGSAGSHSRLSVFCVCTMQMQHAHASDIHVRVSMQRLQSFPRPCELQDRSLLQPFELHCGIHCLAS